MRNIALTIVVAVLLACLPEAVLRNYRTSLSEVHSVSVKSRPISDYDGHGKIIANY